MNKAKKKNQYEEITDRITDLMKQGQIPWVKPWDTSFMGGTKNLISQKEYRGINALLTLGFDLPYFCTYKQAQDIGGQVRKGEKGIPIVFWGIAKNSKNEADSDDGSEENRGRMFMRTYTVFNVSQIDGLPDSLMEKLVKANTRPAKTRAEKNAAAEEIVSKHRIDLRFENVRRAFYSPTLDYINMPKLGQFKGTEEYYSTLFHEMGHWTGHESRLKRKELMGTNFFGSHDYSKEELTAELTAAFVCSSIGISTESSLKNSAAYLQGWLKALKNDPKMIVHASQRAQKAAEFILKTEKKTKKKTA